MSQLGMSTAQATVMDLEALAFLHPSLIHQYTFEGNSIAERKQDKKGSLHLSPLGYGGATEAMIQYQTGFDSTSTAVVTARPGGNTDAEGGGGGIGLTTAPNDLPVPGLSPAMTVELLVRPDQTTVTGGGSHGGISYVLMLREQNTVRGHFLFQGAPGTNAADDNNFTALAGNPFDSSHQKTILNDITAGSWYYYAAVYESVNANADTRITPYFADLTGGQTVLTALTPVVVTGSFSSGGGGQGPLGVGIADNSAISSDPISAFPGAIDALALYGGVLSYDTLQDHLDALWLTGQSNPIPIPEPSSLVLLLIGVAGSCWRKRR